MLDLDDLVYVEFLCEGKVSTVEWFSILDSEFDDAEFDEED